MAENPRCDVYRAPFATKSSKSIYRTLGKTLLISGISLAILTLFDYAIFLANNSGDVHVNPYEYIQYFAIAILILAGIVLIIKNPT